MKNGGGHFAPELGGHFELELGGHFKLELGGQYHWNLHITGKSYRQSIRLMQKMRSDLNKLENQYVSIDEFCNYTSLKFEQVMPLIVDKKSFLKMKFYT
jgi:hypothetical protein